MVHWGKKKGVVSSLSITSDSQLRLLPAPRNTEPTDFRRIGLNVLAVGTHRIFISHAFLRSNLAALQSQSAAHAANLSGHKNSDPASSHYSPQLIFRFRPPYRWKNYYYFSPIILVMINFVSSFKKS